MPFNNILVRLGLRKFGITVTRVLEFFIFRNNIQEIKSEKSAIVVSGNLLTSFLYIEKNFYSFLVNEVQNRKDMLDILVNSL